MEGTRNLESRSACDGPLLADPVSIGGETDAAKPSHADRWWIEMDGLEIKSGERLQLECLPEVLAWAVVALDQRGDPGDDRNLNIRGTVIASPCTVPGQAAADGLLANSDRAFADGLTHRRLVDDIVGAGDAELQLDDRLIDQILQLACHDGDDDILDGCGVGVHHYVTLA